MRRTRHALAGRVPALLLVLLGLPVAAFPSAAADGSAPPSIDTPTTAATRNGSEIYRKFRDGLADPVCAGDSSPRWSRHFAGDSRRLASRRDEVLPLFGYVVDALREANLPTEYALIPFVESGYKPGARSVSGPAGLWQMIARTARNHDVPIRAGYDGRLSPIDSTKAAVRYLKTLHGMFAGDWRLAAMAYNAGEYRIFGALRRGGQVARDAQPEKLPGLAPITHAYVRKIRALSCLLVQAEDDADWVEAVDRPVPHLRIVTLPPGRGLDQWARQNHQDPGQLRRINPQWSNSGGGSRLVLAAAARSAPFEAPSGVLANARDPTNEAGAPRGNANAGRRTHTVVRGDNVSMIALHHGVRLGELLERNGLMPNSVIRPGQVLRIDAPSTSDD